MNEPAQSESKPTTHVRIDVATHVTSTIDERSLDRIDRLERDQTEELEELDQEMKKFFGGRNTSTSTVSKAN